MWVTNPDNCSNYMRQKHFLFAIALLTCTAASAQFADRDQRYHLQPNDVLEIQYRYTPEYNQTAAIEPDGFVSLELVGGVKLSGLTLDEARRAILERVSTRLRDPEISLILKDFDKPHFVVGGEVGSPGRFELRGRTTAVEAIMIAGGFKSNSARHSQVILFRRINEQTGETRILNLKEITNAPKLDEDTVLHEGDILFVPQNRISKIERFVRWGNLGVYWTPIKP